jgi:N-methylhydantoinase A
MSISRVFVPPHPGVFCARGILAMNLVHTDSQSYTQWLDRLDIKELERFYKDMENQASEVLFKEGMSANKIEFIRSIEIGYEDQHYFIETPVPGGQLSEKSRNVITESFEQLHETRYGHRIQAPMKTAILRLKANGKIRDVPVSEISKNKEIPRDAIKKKRQVYLDGKFADTQVFERDKLTWGNIISGPAIIEEPFHTTIVMPGQSLEVDRLGNLIIHTGGV